MLSVPEQSSRWVLRRLDAVALAALFVGSFLLRLTMLLGTNGLRANVGDDAAAYYAGSDAMLHGRLPYRDFILLHPPLLDLLLTPFVALGMLTTDHLGLMVATVVGQLLGGVCAVLVALVARRLGLSRTAAYVAAVFYATWYGAISSEAGVRLEGTSTFVALLGLLALTGVPRRRNTVLGGLAFGACAAIKIWGVVPLLVLFGWGLARRGSRRQAPWFAAGALTSLVLACGPFFLAAPGTMWHMVVLDQLGRRPNNVDRLQRMTGLSDTYAGLTGPAFVVTITVVLVLLAVAFGFAARLPAARPVVLVALAQLITLFVSPSFFSNYDGYVAPSLALTLGAAVQGARVAGAGRLPALHRVGTGVVALTLAGSLAVTGALVVDVPLGIGSTPFPHALMYRAVRHARCPMPDGPIVLIETNTLSSTLARGCQNWIDVSGKLYTLDGPKFPRSRFVPWQRALQSYLLSGDVVINFRDGLGIGPVLQRRIDRLPLIGQQDGFTARRVPPRYRR